MKKSILNLGLVFGLLVNVACEEVATVSILDETDRFEQNSSSFDNKIDILWVVDNSGSMANLQANVAGNFQSFIHSFAAKAFDFQMAVTTTDAWLEVNGNQYCAQSNGTSRYKGNAGSRILTPNTPNLEDAFISNISQGVSGCGDERAFNSMILALENENNIADGFPRKDAFLAVIIVSDEDDFSHDGGDYLGNNYNDARLHDPSLYRDALNLISNSSGDRKRYNVSAIAIYDEDCMAENDPWGLLATRYEALVDLTGGVKASVCATDFAKNLENISETIVSLSSQFYLSREPIIDSITVVVDGISIVEDETNGWTYDALANSIVFHGDSIPAQGSVIDINFDPVKLKN